MSPGPNPVALVALGRRDGPTARFTYGRACPVCSVGVGQACRRTSWGVPMVHQGRLVVQPELPGLARQVGGA